MSIDTSRPPDRPLSQGRPLPLRTPPVPAGPARGLRRLRHISNWTLGALVVGVGATTALIDHAATSQPVTAVSSGAPGAATGATAAPHLSSPVATTTASGTVIPASSGATGTSSTHTRSTVYGADT